MLTARQRTALGESEARGLWMHPPRYHLVGSLSATREDAAYPAGWLFDRLEIEAALTRNVLVIPVLVEGAQMPRAVQLPASLEKLAHRQAQKARGARLAPTGSSGAATQ